MALNIHEALRYLGVKQSDDALLAQASALAQELQNRITPRFTWRAVDLINNSGFRIPDSELSRRVLADCHTAAVLVCTLGAEFDLWVRQLQVRDMALAALLDALGSAYVESGCDAAEEAIRTRYPGMYLTDRFSPGYGDFPLEAQQKLLDFTQARRIGVTLTDSLLMTPQKSVTAVVGIADTPQPARIRGCAHCSMRSRCSFSIPCHKQ
ncbi:MAG: methionine synthase [Clostridia bacterium]|nr:methionine synthase [Clostridia bacterium]